MNFSYNTKYFPPIPRVEIKLGIPDESLKIGPLSAIVDSGADGTLVPSRYIRKLRIEVYDNKFIHSHWGERRTVATYRLDIGIGEIRLPAIEVVADDQGQEIVVGRNILNKLQVLLNGPKLITEIRE